MAEYWGDETRKAVANFPVSGEQVPESVIRWLGRIKSAAATVNAELGVLNGDIARRVAVVADEIGAGEHAAQFPVDIFQTGSGTSTNMNVNEVIAHLAGDDVHPNDHVNLGQSSNDVFPTAVHLAAIETATTRLIPALRSLEASLAAKSVEFADLAKSGRTHLMDAVPITLGQEFGGFAQQVRLGVDRIDGSLTRVSTVPLGGTAVGSGLERAPRLCSTCAGAPQDPDRIRGRRAGRPVRGPSEPRLARRTLRDTQSGRGVADQDRQRRCVVGEWSTSRTGRDHLARAAEGFVDHARQGQPGTRRSGAPGRSPGDRQRHRHHDRRDARQLPTQRTHPV